MSHLDRYTCEEMLRRLDGYVDRELSPAEMERARRHLETCAACAAEFGFQARMLAELRAKLRRIDVPGDLLARIAERLRAAGPLGEGAPG